MRGSLLAAALLTATAAHAGELVLHIGSQHGERNYDHTYTINTVDPGTGNVVVRQTVVEQRPYNNFNPGLGYRFDSGLAVGVYRNSYRKTAAYAAYMPLWQTPMESLKVGGVVMAVTGYEEQTGHSVSIGGSLAARLELVDGYSAYVLYMPKVRSDSVAVGHVMLGKAF